MYRVIVYHGKGNESEVANDLCLLWDRLRDFAATRKIHHVYCFQALKEAEVLDSLRPSTRFACSGLPMGRSPEQDSSSEVGKDVRPKEAHLFLVLQYADDVAAASYPAQDIKHHKMAHLPGRVDYWFYVREERE